MEPRSQLLRVSCQILLNPIQNYLSGLWTLQDNNKRVSHKNILNVKKSSSEIKKQISDSLTGVTLAQQFRIT